MTAGSSPSDSGSEPGLRAFQRQIDRLYGERDRARGVDRTFLWLIEEVGELSRCLRAAPAGDPEEAGEFADCLAWLTTLASLRGIDLAAVAWEKYGSGCPRCASTPCRCRHRAGE